MYIPWIISGVIVLFVIILFNSLVGKRNRVNNAFASIDAYLKKRFDLVPNLVSAVQTYMKHEKSTLTEITELRTRALSGTLSDDEKVDINNKMTKALHSINVAVENYPDLKANTNFLQLQAALNEIEEQLSAARRSFNAAVNEYNNAVQMFPSNLFAMMLGYKSKSYFEATEGERENVSVKDLFNN